MLEGSIRLDHGGSWVQIPPGTRIFFPSPPQINISCCCCFILNIFLIGPAIQHLLTSKAKATVILQISSLDHAGGPCCADAKTKGTHWQKRGSARFFSGRPNAMGFISHANSPCHGIYGFSDWTEIYFKQYYPFPLSFLFLVCTPAIYNLETCHSNGVFSLLRAERPILSVMSTMWHTT